MSTPHEPSDDLSAAVDASKRRAATPPAGAPPPERDDQDPSQAPAAETDGAEDLTLEADEQIQTTGDVAGMSETME